MPYDIEDSVLIDAPPEAVWEWVAGDVDRERAWRNLDGRGVQTLEKLDDGPVREGTRYRGTVKVGPGRPQAYENVVTEVEAPRRISWETADAEGPLLGLGTYRLRPEGESTRFDIFLDYPPRTFLGRFMRPVARFVGARFIARALPKLKGLVEGDGTG